MTQDEGPECGLPRSPGYIIEVRERERERVRKQGIERERGRERESERGVR